MIKIFISHSNQDSPLAEMLVRLLREATNLLPSEIRCTSVAGYRLKGGSNTNEVLKNEVLGSDIFVGIISKVSLSSTYVLFELGARWSTGKILIPLLAPDMTISDLEAPLSSLHCHSCMDASQLHQFITEVAEELRIKTNSPASYQKLIDKIISDTKSQNIPNDITAEIGLASDSSSGRDGNLDEEKSVLQIIREIANDDHPNDYSTQKYIISEQLSAWKKLSNFVTFDIPEDVLKSILTSATNDHPHDYSTQLYVVQEQIEAWKEVNGQGINK